MLIYVATSPRQIGSDMSGFDSLAPIIATAVAGVSGIVATSLTAFLQRLQRRSIKAVEQEMIRALGIGESPDQNSQTFEDIGRVFGDHVGGDKHVNGAKNENEHRNSNNNQHIEVNIGSTNESSEALAEIAAQQSDGHARLIVKYYAQGHQQAFTTFIASVAFAIVGFGVIIAACIYLFLHPSEPEPAAISGAVGLATQGVSYLFFRRADKARELMMSLIDRLRQDREREVKFIAGMASTNSISSPSLRDAVRVATAMHLAGTTLTPEQIESIAKHATDADRQNQPNIFINPLAPHGTHTGESPQTDNRADDDDPRPTSTSNERQAT